MNYFDTWSALSSLDLGTRRRTCRRSCTGPASVPCIDDPFAVGKSGDKRDQKYYFFAFFYLINAISKRMYKEGVVRRWLYLKMLSIFVPNKKSGLILIYFLPLQSTIHNFTSKSEKNYPSR